MAFFRSAATDSTADAVSAGLIRVRASAQHVSRRLGQPGCAAARAEAAVQFVDEPDQTTDDSAASRLQIAAPEALQQYIGHEAGQGEVDDRRRFVSEAMIQGQMSGQRIEAIVFDVPPTMAGMPELARRKLALGKRGGPIPA